MQAGETQSTYPVLPEFIALEGSGMELVAAVLELLFVGDLGERRVCDVEHTLRLNNNKPRSVDE